MPAWSHRCCYAAGFPAAPRPPLRSDTTTSGLWTRASSTTAGSFGEGRWVVLHYMFFYAMNDWRSTFEGANDHEADLEQCFVVLEALDDGTMGSRPGSAPRHTTRRATTCDAVGTTLGMEILDGHPVVYPGAGSHATYLERGEYIMLLPFPGERNVRGPLDLLRRVWRDTSLNPTRATLRRGRSAPSACRSSTTPAATEGRRSRGRHRVDADHGRATRTAGSIGIGACGVSTPATGSRVSVRPPGRSTRGQVQCVSRGTIRSASPVSARSHLRRRRSRSSRHGSRSCPPPGDKVICGGERPWRSGSRRSI